MIEDKIALHLKDLRKLKQELHEIKKDVKDEEKIETEEYLELKRTYKDLKTQVKDLEEKTLLSLAQDTSYQQLKEKQKKKEEEIAQLNAKLFEVVGELPPKFFQMNVETEEGPVRVQIQPEMRLYLNGKEEKKRV